MIMLAFGLMPAPADTQTWSVGTGDWFTVDNWTNTLAPADTRVPTNGDDVVVTNLGAFVYLTNSTAWLSSLVISNAIVSCSNWDTTLYVTNLTIKKSGVLTCIGSFTNNVISNRVSLNCTTLIIETNGTIDVNGKGYPSCNGPGYGIGYQGASYGGAGRYGYGSLQTNTYGSVTAPLYPGSGGGNDLGSLCERIVLVGLQTKDKFPAQVDFITTPGHLTGGDSRRQAGLEGQGPIKVITQLGVFGFHPESKRMMAISLNPGITPEIVELCTGFQIIFPDDITITEMPDKTTLNILRTQVDPLAVFTKMPAM